MRHVLITFQTKPLLSQKITIFAYSTVDTITFSLTIMTPIYCQPTRITFPMVEIGLMLASKTYDAGAGLTVLIFLVTFVTD